MSILVSGGAGYIGSHTCVELLNAGYDIVVADNLYNASPEALARVKQITGKDFRFIEADMTDRAAVDAIFKENPGIECVIQFAAYKAVGESVSKPIEYYSNNLNCTLTILDVMRHYGCHNIIFSSSATVYGDPATVPIREDFPTGATILGRRGIEEAYRTGRAKIKVRAVTNIETMANGKSRIIVTELPYMVNKARLIEKIADLVKEKKIDGITYIGDESNREGMRINIELRRDVNANVILNQLLKHTQLQDTFGVIMLALINNQPKVLNLH